MKIYEELVTDHKRIRAVIERIQETSSRAVKSRSELLGALSALVIAHEKAEESVFYKGLLDDDLTHEEALEMQEEHRLCERSLRELEDVDPSEERWMAKFHVLRETLERHFEKEERGLFEKAQKIVSEEEAEEMAMDFIDVRTDVMAELGTR